MKKVLLIVCCLFQSILTAQSAVTYTFSGGRLGDNLLSYCHAKWVSCRFKIPLLYKPFAYSDQLMMDNLEIKYDESIALKFANIVTVQSLNQIDPQANTLYVVPYFPESVFELIRPWPDFTHHFVVDWNNLAFKKELQKMISPINKIDQIQLPEGYISVAVHVRKGTGFDIGTITEFNDLCRDCPVKMPPDSYYIEQIKKVSKIFNNKPLYIYLFTDHDNPQEIVELYQTQLDQTQIVFDYRKDKNRHDMNVLEDFFSLTTFDCLIRPDSNFSLMASKLSDNQDILYPSGYKISENCVIITQTTMIMASR